MINVASQSLRRQDLPYSPALRCMHFVYEAASFFRVKNLLCIYVHRGRFRIVLAACTCIQSSMKSLFGLKIFKTPENACFRLKIGHSIVSNCQNFGFLQWWGGLIFYQVKKSALWTDFWCTQHCLGFVHRSMYHNAGEYGTNTRVAACKGGHDTSI